MRSTRASGIDLNATNAGMRKAFGRFPIHKWTRHAIKTETDEAIDMARSQSPPCGGSTSPEIGLLLRSV